MTTPNSPIRRASKELTRQALVRAVLDLLADRSLDSLSLREITREAGITPTAFYRHYRDIEELGLILTEESFRSFGPALREAGVRAARSAGAVEGIFDAMVGPRSDSLSHLRFIVRERDGGVRRVRRAIRRELQLVADELAVDLADVAGLDGRDREDRRTLAGLVTETLVRLLADMIDAEPERQGEIVTVAGRRLRLLGLGDAPAAGGPHS
jgi:AcrR family transcriptional regulator